METKQIISWLLDKAARAQDHSYARMLNQAAKRLKELDEKVAKDTNVLTNGDRIRAWNNHELAESISHFICDMNEGVEYSDNPNSWLEWLEQPVEVDHES